MNTGCRPINASDSKYVLAKVHLVGGSIAFTFEPVSFTSKLDRITVDGLSFISALNISSFGVAIQFSYKDLKPFAVK